jgi:prepilin-type N-terminal cleavage/methylation domain-containing protein
VFSENTCLIVHKIFDEAILNIIGGQKMNLQKQDGMTLLEVLVAMAIFGLLLGVIMTMMQQSIELGQNSKRLLKAQLKANEIMEAMRTRPFDELWNSPEPVVVEAKPRKVEVLMTDFNDSPSLKKIVVSVSWRMQQGHERQYTLETLRSRFSPVYIKAMNDIALKRLAQGEGE